MAITDGLLNQTITVWQASGQRDVYGKETFTGASPFTVKGRWESVDKLDLGVDGEELSANSVLYLADLDLTTDSWVFLGTSVAADPQTVTGAERIKSVQIFPAISGTEELRRYVV